MSNVVYIDSTGMTSGGFGSWAHTGDELQLDWVPGGGEVLEVLGVPNILPYDSDQSEVFGDVPETVSDVVSQALRERLNMFICEQMKKRAMRLRDAELAGFWERELSVHERAYAICLQDARGKFGRHKYGTEVGMRRTFP